MSANETFTHVACDRFLGQHRLMGCRCRACGALFLPPRPTCPACHSDAIEWSELSGQGTLRAFTIIHVAPTAMVNAGYGRDRPYCVGIVRLAEGPSVRAQIVGVDATRPETIAIGQPLEATFIARGKGENQRTYLVFRVPQVDAP